MSADPSPYGDMPQSRSTASADTKHNQAAPTANGNSFKDAVVNNTAAAMNVISNHPVTQNAKETLTNGTQQSSDHLEEALAADHRPGPVAESVKIQSTKTKNEFAGLATSRVQPDHTAANGQSLTHYHSFFYTLLSWEHPRATAISFATTLLFIFATRYLPLLRWVFKISYLAFGVTALAEVAGKVVMGTGLATSFRPRRYYRVPKETLETFLDDIEQLVNFFVIEFQRILFAENIAATVAAFLSAFVSYYLIKIVPVWGLSLLSTCVIYLAPLVYVKNKEVIDGQLEHASEVITAQTGQIKDIAGERTSKGLESVKQYTGEYAAKAQNLMGSARQKIPTTVGGRSKPALNENIKQYTDDYAAKAHNVMDSARQKMPTTVGGESDPAAVGDSVKQYTGDYAANVQNLMGSARQKMPTTVGGETKPAAISDSVKQYTDEYAAKAQNFMGSARENMPTTVGGESEPAINESVRQYTDDYAAKAQDLMGSARQKMSALVGGQSEPAVNENEFPQAPTSEPVQGRQDVGSADGPMPAY